MAWIGLLVLTYLAAFGAASTLWGKGPIRVHQLSSIVVREYLYLDAGEIIYPGPGYAISGATLRIPLTSNWTTSNVQASYGLKRIPYPFARQPALWSDGSNLYSAGGITFYFPDCTFSCLDAIWRPSSNGNDIIGADKDGHASPALTARLQTVPIDIYQFPLDEFNFKYNGKEQFWFKAPHQIPHGYSKLQATVGASYGNRFYAMSGFTGEPYAALAPTNWLRGVPGIASWNVGGSDWKNVSTTGFKPGGTIAMGRGIPVPFGEKGSIVYIGGYAPPSDHRFNFTSRAALADMSQINVFDIASETFLSQKASGSIPIPRWSFCAAGASESNSGTFDIFISGGFAGLKNSEAIRPSLQKVYVLSLPSFTWTETTAPKQQMRSSATCQVIGNRQMIVVGGANPADAELGDSSDPWTNFMGLFDMTQWEWKFNYNSEAQPYKRNKALVKSSRQRKYPHTWDSTAVQALFQKNMTTFPDSSSDSLGVKVGVPVAVVGLVLIVAAFLFWRWKKRRARLATSTQEEPDKEEQTYCAEMPDKKAHTYYAEAPNEQSRHEVDGGKQLSELGPHLPHELESSPNTMTDYWKSYSMRSSDSVTMTQELEA